MPQYLFKVTLGDTTGITRDQVVNDFSATTDAGEPSAADLLAACTAVSHFYTNVPAGATAALGSYLSPTIARGAGNATVKCYRRPNAPGLLGSPVALFSMPAIPAASIGAGLPSEVAVVLALHADLTNVPQTGTQQDIPTSPREIRHGAPATHLGQVRPASRKRGRIFIGPLDRGALAADGNGRPIVVSTVQTILTKAYLALANEWKGIATPFHAVVFSQRDFASNRVVLARVDDAYDTQRRRGERPVGFVDQVINA